MGAPIARVYNQADARAHGYHPLTCNPVIPPDGLHGGRFDATPADPYAYLYLSGGSQPLGAALAEALFNRALPGSTAGYLELAEVHVLDIASEFALPNDEYPLLCLRTADECARVGAPTDVAQHEDYEATREWAAFWRSQILPMCGIRYPSRRLGSSADNVVLFADRCGTNTPVTSMNFPYRYGDVEGRRVFRATAIRQRVLIM